MTDVTGFGLAGHLMTILTASGLAATLDLGALPILPGAEMLAAKGIASTLAPVNRSGLAGRMTAPGTPRAALLFDPQTAGGLLAAVPAGQAAGILKRLLETAPLAAVIGRLSEGPPRITAL
jgi:selenide,water dikinase